MEKQIRFLRLPTVMERTGLSRSTIYFLIEQSQFPPSVKLGTRSVAWLESEIEEWMESKVSAREGGGDKVFYRMSDKIGVVEK